MLSIADKSFLPYNSDLVCLGQLLEGFSVDQSAPACKLTCLLLLLDTSQGTSYSTSYFLHTHRLHTMVPYRL